MSSAATATEQLDRDLCALQDTLAKVIAAIHEGPASEFWAARAMMEARHAQLNVEFVRAFAAGSTSDPRLRSDLVRAGQSLQGAHALLDAQVRPRRVHPWAEVALMHLDTARMQLGAAHNLLIRTPALTRKPPCVKCQGRIYLWSNVSGCSACLD